jgi:hypothetical protein
LHRDEIRSVLVRGGCDGGSRLGRLGFVLNASMRDDAIDAAIEALHRVLRAAAA